MRTLRRFHHSVFLSPILKASQSDRRGPTLPPPLPLPLVEEEESEGVVVGMSESVEGLGRS